MKEYLLAVVVLLVAVTPASAGWILYRQEAGQWRAGQAYEDLTVCETDAKALADKLQVLVGCAPPRPVGGTSSPAAPSTGAQPQTMTEELAARKARRIQADKERRASETVTECERTPSGTSRCTTKPRW